MNVPWNWLIVYNGFFTALRASLVAQTVKNPPAMQETWIGSLGQKDPLEKGMATHSSFFAMENSMRRGA